MSSTHKKGRTPVHEVNFKIAIAREYLTGNLGYGALAKKHNLNLGTVRFFVKWYRTNYEKPVVEEQRETELPQVNKDEKKQLKEANLKITALEMLIENAGKELGVDLVKKFGTKQSKK